MFTLSRQGSTLATRWCLPHPLERVRERESDSTMPLKTHKIALDANNKQRGWFAQQCGYARFAYNHALADFKAGLENDAFQSAFTLNKRFNQTKKAFDWTYAMDQRAAMYSIYANLASAIKNWVDKRSRFPRFKRRGGHQSYTTDEQSVIVETSKGLSLDFV